MISIQVQQKYILQVPQSAGKKTMAARPDIISGRCLPMQVPDRSNELQHQCRMCSRGGESSCTHSLGSFTEAVLL